MDGLVVYRRYLSPARQHALLEAVRGVIAAAPLYAPRMPKSGRPMSVRMTNCGPLGWYTDQAQGYRYVDRHPETGRPWPAMPEAVLRLWRDLADFSHPPEACLINYYGAPARMGLHRDADEAAREAPVISISLGCDALFRIGGLRRDGPTESMRLKSGDAVILGGAARHRYHGIDRIYPETSSLLEEGGRFNLTLRRVTLP